MINVLALVVIALSVMGAHAESIRITNALKDPRGNLIATFRKKDYGPEKVMYCRPTECTELVSTESAFSNRDTVYEFKFNGEKDHAEVRINTTVGRYKLTCPTDKVFDVQNLSVKDQDELKKKIESGQLKTVSAPAIRKPVFLYKVKGTGELIYQDTAESEDNEIYVGTPGKMVKIKSSPLAPQNRCNWASFSCRDQYYTDVGAKPGSEEGKFLDVTGKKFGKEEIESVEKFDVATLKIPGQPPAKDYNPINPCTPDGPGKAAVIPAPAPASPPSAR